MRARRLIVIGPPVDVGTGEKPGVVCRRAEQKRADPLPAGRGPEWASYRFRCPRPTPRPCSRPSTSRPSAISVATSTSAQRRPWRNWTSSPDRPPPAARVRAHPSCSDGGSARAQGPAASARTGYGKVGGHLVGLVGHCPVGADGGLVTNQGGNVRVLSRKTAATCAATSADLTETPACRTIVEKASG